MIWDYKNILTRRLFLWAGLSILAGLVMSLFCDGIWQSFGILTLVWGLFDSGQSLLALRRAGNQLGRLHTRDEEEKETGRVRKRLWYTAAFGALLLAGASVVVYFWQPDSPFWRGAGIGMVAQCVFQIIFSIRHALKVPEPLQLPHLPLFTHPDHEPFLFEGGKPAAVLVHGFPGTALEMRHLGKALNESGWTVRGMRLPGFGPDLVNVIQYNNDDWVAAVLKEINALRKEGHAPLLLVGFSFGGGLALQAAAREPIDGLVLIAPLTWHEPRAGKVVLDFIRALLPLSIYPFRYIRPEHPMIEEEFLQYLPEIHLDDPEQAHEIPYLQMPLYILDQVRAVGREALTAATDVHVPTLLIQGTQDKVIHFSAIKYLRKRLGGPVTYETVDGSHSLTMPHNPAFDDVKTKITAFAEKISSSAEQRD
jgi:esterase/lipase